MKQSQKKKIDWSQILSGVPSGMVPKCPVCGSFVSEGKYSKLTQPDKNGCGILYMCTFL